MHSGHLDLDRIGCELAVSRIRVVEQAPRRNVPRSICSWTHQTSSSTNCYTGDEWNTGICPDPVTCAANCAIDGADYEGTYGIVTTGDSMSIKLVTVGQVRARCAADGSLCTSSAPLSLCVPAPQYDTNIGARTYVMADPTHYKMYTLKNREFVFDVDVSAMPCGLDGALYFVRHGWGAKTAPSTLCGMDGVRRPGPTRSTCAPPCPSRAQVDMDADGGMVGDGGCIPRAVAPPLLSRCASPASPGPPLPSAPITSHIPYLSPLQSKYPGDQAGAAYGTGYCDAQCPHDIKFINGEVSGGVGERTRSARTTSSSSMAR